MFAKTLSRSTLRALKVLGKSKLLNKAYLAGGTALALRLGHRKSLDFDFFTRQDFNEKILVKKLTQLGQFVKQDLAEQTILGKFMGVKFSLFYYQYPLLENIDEFEGIKVAGLKDIAAMKIHAVGDRGTKRDFIDLYFLAREFSLEEMFNLYDQKFGKLEERKYHLLRSLRYFEDAEKDPAPEMLVSVDWDQVRRFFIDEVKRLAGKLLL